MPYVSRDESGAINGVYANLQEGYAEEYLPDDNPEVVAFLENQALSPPAPTNEQQILFDHENRILVMEGEPPLTLGDFIAKING